MTKIGKWTRKPRPGRLTKDERRQREEHNTLLAEVEALSAKVEELNEQLENATNYGADQALRANKLGDRLHAVTRNGRSALKLFKFLATVSREEFEVDFSEACAEFRSKEIVASVEYSVATVRVGGQSITSSLPLEEVDEQRIVGLLALSRGLCKTPRVLEQQKIGE